MMALFSIIILLNLPNSSSMSESLPPGELYEAGEWGSLLLGKINLVLLARYMASRAAVTVYWNVSSS